MTRSTAIDDVLGADALRTTGTVDAAATGSKPASVIAPASDDEVAEVARWAAASGHGILPFGSGHTLRPVRAEGPWVALTTERRSGVEIYEAADLTITVGAGTPMAEVDRTLRGEGQWAPFDAPETMDGTVGGLVARGRSGPLEAGYGALRNHVLGATLVTGDGRVLRLGGRVVKNVAGFDLLKPLVGSRGCLGVITSVCLRAFPEPVEDRVYAVAADAAALAPRVATAPVVPASAVVSDRADGFDGPVLFVRLHGGASTVDADRSAIEAHLSCSLEEVASGRDASTVLMSEGGRRGVAGAVRIRVSARPSRFEAIVGTIRDAGSTGFCGDVMDGAFDAAFDDASPEVIHALTSRVESLDGAVEVLAAPAAHDAWGHGTVPEPDVEALTESVRRSFDPARTLWPASRP